MSKLCVDCRYYDVPVLHRELTNQERIMFAQCLHPKVKRFATEHSVVIGAYEEEKPRFCASMRGSGPCTHEGLLFEAKEK